MRHEVYWHHLFGEASLLINRFEVEGPPLPSTFELWFKAQRRMHVVEGYSHILSSMKSASDTSNMPEIMFSTKRLVYR